MEDGSEKFLLDQSAQQLYRQFAGLDEQNRIRASEGSALMQLLIQEEKQLDYYRLLLAEATTSFVGILSNSRFTALSQDNLQKIKAFIATMAKIAKLPKAQGKMVCRLRGQQCPDGRIGSEIYDYEISFGNLLLNSQVAQIVSERAKNQGAMINAKLMEAFRALSAMKLFNFSMDLGQGDLDNFQQLARNLQLLVRYYGKGGEDAQFVVRDEYSQPHINLTILSAFNGVPPGSMQQLVEMIKPRLLGENPDPQLLAYTTAYDVILASKRTQAMLSRMPIEINNVQWLTQAVKESPEQTARTVKVSRFVLAKFGNNPKMAFEVMSSISREGYTEIRTEVMGKRLARATDFLKLSEESADQKNLHHEALQNIEKGMEQVPDKIYDSIKIREDGGVSTVDAEGRQTSWEMHEKIQGLLGYFKQRSATKKKVLGIANSQVTFDERDYSVFARSFKISEEQAAHLLNLLKSCFDTLGHFRRPFFERNIPEFVRFGNMVFEFLWHYLKELEDRNDRISFLNAMHPLVLRLANQREALQTLLTDIFNRTGEIKASDRNGLILASLLLVRNNQQTSCNIEQTPEEVLKIREGINREMVEAVADFMAQNRDLVINKFRGITETLLKVSAGDEPGKGANPLFLLLLQREMVIFLALAGGESSLAIIQGVVRDFGDPASTYYQTMAKKENLRYSLQLLQVAVRSLRRFEDPQAISQIDAVSRRAQDFILLSEDPAYRNYLQKVFENIRRVD
jgi:hypothetical protein